MADPESNDLWSVLSDAPDIAFYEPDEFFKVYTEWFETRRSVALKNGLIHSDGKIYKMAWPRG